MEFIIHPAYEGIGLTSDFLLQPGDLVVFYNIETNHKGKYLVFEFEGRIHLLADYGQVYISANNPAELMIEIMAEVEKYSDYYVEVFRKGFYLELKQDREV